MAALILQLTSIRPAVRSGASVNFKLGQAKRLNAMTPLERGLQNSQRQFRAKLVLGFTVNLLEGPRGTHAIWHDRL
jgi:hypothetical protein